MTATWAALTVYSIGNVVNPTVANGFSFVCVDAGTSGASEPTWSGRWPAVVDGSAAWAPYSIITPAMVRTQLGLEGTTGQYSDDTIGGYILAAVGSLEQATNRYLRNRPGASYSTTSYGRPILALPGLRTASAVTWMGSLQTASIPGQGNGYTLLPDALQTGVFTGIQFRPLHTGAGPWWLSLGGPTTNWFDTNADSPFDPRNYGGGYVYTSVPGDTIVVGDWAYEPGFEPANVVHAVEVLSEWYTMRPPAILADSVITPAGGIVSYSQMPPEVQQFVKSFSAGQQAVSV